MQNALAHVDGIDFRRAVLQQAIRKPACGRADIRADKTFHIHRERIQRALQFFSAARDEARAGVNRQRGFCVCCSGRFEDDLIVDSHLSGHDQGLRLGA